MARHILAILILCSLTACATDQAFQQGKKLIEQGQVEEGLPMVRQAAADKPGVEEYRTYYLRTRDRYVDQLLYEADKARLLGRLADAASGYNRALTIDSENSRAMAGLDAVAAEEIRAGGGNR